ncbi:MAG: pyrimidine 5'-nucleotidase [Zetaproteobacteria bacterium]|nr:MAG: pyrimidine 5'-nucleotidase [Zetaproteobacteria bacterium]
MRLAIVDLDNTLYRADLGVFARMNARITAFMIEELGLAPEEADRLRQRYWRQYGSTLYGLIRHHGVDPERYLQVVHDVAPEELINPDPALDAALAAIPVRKVIHTNATREHAERVLAALGVRRHFAAIYDIRFDGYRPKPNERALLAICAEEKVRPNEALVVDDAEENLAAARRLGCLTAHVSETPNLDWDFAVSRPHALAALWRAA